MNDIKQMLHDEVTSGEDYIRELMERENELAHFGTKGMKWGYEDGIKNGKRTARSSEYIDKATANLASQKDLINQMNLAEHRGENTKYRNLSKKKNTLAKELKNIAGDIIISNGRDYALGFIAGKFIRDIKNSAKAGNEWLQKKFGKRKRRRGRPYGRQTRKV